MRDLYLKHLSEELLYSAEELKYFNSLLENPWPRKFGERFRIHLIKMDVIIKEMLLKIDEEFK